MFAETKELPVADDLLKHPPPYSELQTKHEEILHGKRDESGMVVQEVGFERALADWLIKHRSSWRKS
jgi:hypothetical protein